MKPALLLLLMIALSFCSIAAVGVRKDKGACPQDKKKITKNIMELALKAVQVIPEKEPQLPQDHILGFSLFKF